MKNRFLKGAHVPESKIHELLRLFSDDLNATQIAEISGISRITVNAYLKLIRTLLAEHSNDHDHLNTVLEDIITEHNNGHPASRPLYGLCCSNERINVVELRNLHASLIHDWLRKKNNDRTLSEQLKRFDAIADLNTLMMYRTTLNGVSNHGDHLDQFWGMLRSRMVKFRGLNAGTIFLHVNETAFRYNNRDKELYDVIVRMIQQRPLHLSKRN